MKKDMCKMKFKLESTLFIDLKGRDDYLNDLKIISCNELWIDQLNYSMELEV